MPELRARLGNVVVATDFTEHARLALDRAALLPLGEGATVELLHVLPSASATAASADARRLLDRTRDDLGAALAAGPKLAHEVFSSVDRGSPASVIVERAHHGRAELIVLGRHGERRWRDRILGSTVDRVVRHAGASVLVVHTAAAAPYRRPIVAVDMSASSRLALELVARLTDPRQPELDVLHVVPYSHHQYTSDTALVPPPERPPAEIEQDAREELAAFLSTIDLGVRWNVNVVLGEPRASILKEAERRDSDLIALGTTGRSRLGRVLVGSVAEGVLHQASCDVLVARLPEP